MTEAKIDALFAAIDGLEHRLVRLAGDAAALSDAMFDAKAGPSVDRWATEVERVSRELASSLEVLKRLADDASETAVISVTEFAEVEPDDSP